MSFIIMIYIRGPVKIIFDFIILSFVLCFVFTHFAGVDLMKLVQCTFFADAKTCVSIAVYKSGSCSHL